MTDAGLDRYAAGPVVEVEIHRAERRGRPSEVVAMWVGMNEDRDMFGLISNHYQRLTHMSYRVEEGFAARVLDHAETIAGGWFWFDAGQTCPEIKISADELRRAFVHLEMIAGE